MAEMSAVIGIVNIHAQTIFPATPQRTAESLFVAPTPTIAPVMVWVVLTGMPAMDAPIIEHAAAASALKPPMGCNLVIFVPIVFTIRQPPNIVPIAITAYQAKIIQVGIEKVGPKKPLLNSAMAMIPIVFCASLPP